ncbi:DNA-binding protein [Aeromicrobium phragmitis]|uniref:DNA-binding protein n=2 Tax=Aeromicrobium phragmitis TaxID=2478914 RepID=A0A3L8PIQ2_9ACTN|nr:DNA-binding protein [Aeromicrobium phragmitis]
MLDDGEHITLPAGLTAAIRFVLDGLTQGDVSIRSMPDELTSTTAADLLGVSRPTLMKFVREGQLHSRKVGTHHRFAHHEVLELLRRRREMQRSALDELRRIDDELGIDD